MRVHTINLVPCVCRRYPEEGRHDAHRPAGLQLCKGGQGSGEARRVGDLCAAPLRQGCCPRCHRKRDPFGRCHYRGNPAAGTPCCLSRNANRWRGTSEIIVEVLFFLGLVHVCSLSSRTSDYPGKLARIRPVLHLRALRNAARFDLEESSQIFVLPCTGHGVREVRPQHVDENENDRPELSRNHQGALFVSVAPSAGVYDMLSIHAAAPLPHSK